MGLKSTINSIVGMLRKWALPVVVSLLAICSALSLLGKYNIVCEVLSHFVAIFCIVLAVLALVSVRANARRCLVVACLCLVPHVYRILPQFLPPQSDKQVASQQLKVIFFNCEGRKNRKPDSLRDIASKDGPDVICFCEIDDAWTKRIEAEFPDYRYKDLFSHYGGVGIISKLPIVSSNVLLSPFRNRPRMLTRLRMNDGSEVAVLVVHPSIPLNTAAFAGRNQDFKYYVRDMAAQNCPRIIVGDFNCTPWSYYYKKLLHDSKLVDAASGYGPRLSWSLGGRFFPVLPIDHCLVSKDIVVTKNKIEPDAGSDHRPCFFNLSVRSNHPS